MPLTREQVVKHLTPPPGISMPPYPKERDRLYRVSLIALAVGISGEAAVVFLHQPLFESVVQGFTALAALVASYSFLVWLANWRWLVRVLAFLGLVAWPWWHLGGWAATLAAVTIMAAKETHCFHFRAGKILPWYSVALGIALVIRIPPAYAGAGWAVLAILWWWLAIARNQLPLFEIGP